MECMLNRIRFPYPWQWGTPTVQVGEAFVMLAAAFVSIVEVEILTRFLILVLFSL